METKQRIDWPLFISGLVITLALALPLAIWPEAGAAVVDNVFDFMTFNFKWAFLLFGLFCIIFLLILAFGKYGNIKMGGPEDQPEFSNYTWAAMIFCAGIGIAIVYWAFIEPVYYIGGPPLNIEPGSSLAAEWAGMLGQFHWTIIPWAIYCIPTIPIAYAIHVKKMSILRLSGATQGLLGPLAQGPLGKVIDVLVIFAMIGGVGTSLGLAVPLVTALVSNFTGLEPTFGLQLLILAAWTALFTLTVYSGLKKGMAKLANFNTYLAYFLLGFVFVMGPTVFILNAWVNSLGIMLNDFFRIGLATNPTAVSASFTEWWTVFYWAWWIAYAPMMGLFVARISRGRTIRQIILGKIIFGSLGCSVFFAIWGGYAVNVQFAGLLDVATIVADRGMEATVVAILESLPAGKLLIIPLYTVLCFIFLATTLNSAAYTLSSQVTSNLRGDEEPFQWNRTLWGILIGLFAVGLLATGSLRAVQLSSVVVALPLMPVLLIMVVSLMKWLKEDYGDLVEVAPITKKVEDIKKVV